MRQRTYMRHVIPLFFSILIVVSGRSPSMQARETAVTKRLPPLIAKVAQQVPFSFIYDGKRSRALLSSWKRTYRKQSEADGTERHITTYTDPITGLEASAEVKLFADSGAVECLLLLPNTGHEDTGLGRHELGVPHHVGPIASIDVFSHYHPDPNFVRPWRDAGTLSVEMEASAHPSA